MSKKNFSKRTVASSFFSNPVPSRLPPASVEDTIIKIPLNRLEPYPNQPFHAYAPDKLLELAEDIQENGILSPVIVRPFGGNYQILSGHNRVAAAGLAKLTEAPCIVKIVNDDEAMLVLVNTNLNQRQELLPSEKAKAYQMRMNAQKRQGKRTDLTSSPEETKLDTATQIAEQESRANVFRYLRLNQLQPELMEMVDHRRLAFKAAVQFSYLSMEHQIILTTLLKKSHWSFDEKKAEQLRSLVQESEKPFEILVQDLFHSTKHYNNTKPTRKISIVVPTDQLMLKQLHEVRIQFNEGSGMYQMLSEIINKMTDISQ